MTQDVFICDYIRTPIGRFGGALSSIRPDDLGAIALRALMARQTATDWAMVDDVIFGCANQAGEDNRNVARMSKHVRKTKCIHLLLLFLLCIPNFNLIFDFSSPTYNNRFDGCQNNETLLY